MLKIDDFKPFVPSNDYEVSKAFYEHIGFKINWDAGEVCEVDTGSNYRFLLLPKNHNNYAHSLMLHFMVSSAQEWYNHFSSIKLVEHFEGTKVAEPKLMPYRRYDKMNVQQLMVLFVAVVAGFLASQAVADTTSAAGMAEAELKLFAVEIKVGSNWDSSKAPNEQAFFKEHSANLKRLRDEGHIVMGARYSDIGLIIFSASSIADVASMMKKDPAMTAGTFVFEVHALSVFYPGLVQAGSRR